MPTPIKHKESRAAFNDRVAKIIQAQHLSLVHVFHCKKPRMKCAQCVTIARALEAFTDTPDVDVAKEDAS